MSERDEVEPIWRDIKAGIIRNVSVGYRVHRFERVAKADRTDGGPRALYRAVDWEPLEISAVAIGADPGAGMRSEARQSDARQFPCAITTKGRNMPEDTIAAGADETRNTPAPAQTPAIPQAAPAAPDAESIRAEERSRVSTIMTLCARHDLGSDLANDLIARGVSINAAREAVLDALGDANPLGRTVELAPAQARGTGDAAYRDAVADAIMHRAAPSLHSVSPQSREFAFRSLMDLARHAVERAGVNTAAMPDMEIAGFAMGMRSAGYHSTGDFPAILSSVVNRTLRAAYDATPRTFGAWSTRVTVRDFRPVDRLQIGNAPDLVKVPEGGEFTYGTATEGKESYAIATYGRIIGFSRQMLINDDLRAFDRVVQSFGASAANLESDILYSILLSNPAMGDGTALFHANHGNLGTAAAITEESLTAMLRAFAVQKDIDGRAITVLPRNIIVPPGKRMVEIYKQLAATTPGSTAEVNPYSNRFSVVEEIRLVNTAGPDPWFAATDPAFGAVEYAYLAGQEGLYTEHRVGFEVDGIEFKARHDFGAKAIDWRGLYKNPGLA
ncbi:prohead protease/major capsid protein fusion protein [Paracoccus sp. 22332]|uniref:prohead protease/major capsid protein fusion protein n=1 Tax=Paracoccus sp. 22332 TaxID=3453913 RepID=UPI003F85F9DF